MIKFGIVEDVRDPKELGRARVRVFGIHTFDKNQIPTATLPWASVVQPTTSAANSGVGETPRLLPGSLVMVYFLDGEEAQFPIITGTLPSEITPHFLTVDNSSFPRGTKGIGFQDPNNNFPKTNYIGENDLPKHARNNTVIQSPDSEFYRYPESFINSLFKFNEPGDLRILKEYPYNQVKQSQSGHFEEWDDTPGNERINRQHSSGTFEEWRPDGTSVTKIFHNRYTLILDSDNIYIGGNVNVHINGDANMYVQGNQNLHVAGNQYTQIDGNKVEVVQGNTETQVFGNTSNYIKGNVEDNIKGSLAEEVGGTVSEQYGALNTYSNGGTNIDGGEIHLNSGNASSFLGSLIEKTPLISKEYDLEFALPLIEAAGRFAAFDEENTIGSTPASYPVDTDKSSGTIKTVEVGANKAKPKAVTTEGIGDRVNYDLQLSDTYNVGSFSRNALFPHRIVSQGGRSVATIQANLKALAVNVAEPILTKYPGVRINSAFRKGSGKSQHDRGQAIDIQWPGLSVKEYLERAKWIAENIAFDQIILEHGNSIWLHISYNGEGSQRGKTLTMYKGKYESGLKLYY